MSASNKNISPSGEKHRVIVEKDGKLQQGIYTKNTGIIHTADKTEFTVKGARLPIDRLDQGIGGEIPE